MISNTLRNSGRVIAATLLSAGATLSLHAGSCCSETTTTQNAPACPVAGHAEMKTMACCAEMQPNATALTDNSIYQVASKWTDQDGNTMPLARLAGKPQLIAMVYTSCQYACPRIIADLKAIEKQLPQEPVGITVVSIDPARDTPERLKQYAQEHDLDLSRWTLLHGDAGDVLELANLLGVRFKQTPTGDFSHSNIITLLDEHGEVVYQQNGLGADNASTLAKLNELLSRASESSVAKTPIQ